MNANDPFHPVYDDQTNEMIAEHSGISLRTHIATAAMNGLLSNPAFSSSREEIARFAVNAADALIASLNSIPIP